MEQKFYVKVMLKSDYEIKGTYKEGLDLLKICIRTIFVNPDKKYV